MVILNYEIWEENRKVGGPYRKEFNSEDELYSWRREQDGHPWLYLRTISIEKSNEVQAV